jgi:hypothetical protein
VGGDQGDDVNGNLVMPDGSPIDFDMWEDQKTREMISTSKWALAAWADREDEGRLVGPSTIGRGDRAGRSQGLSR